MTEEDGSRVRRIGAEHFPRGRSDWHRADLVADWKHEIAAMRVGSRRFPPAGAELAALRPRVVREEMPGRERNLDAFENGFDCLAFWVVLVGTGKEEVIVGEAPARKQG